MFYQKMLAEQKKLDTKIHTLENELQKLPKGSLICSQNGKYYKWYHFLDNKLSYIPKKNRPFAEQLALKKILSLQLKTCIAEKRSVDAYLKQSTSKADYPDDFLLSHPEFQNLVSAHYTPHSLELQKWCKEDFEKNPKHPEQLIQKTISGNTVRSKSEAMIDTLLYVNQIPFRYECALSLGFTTLYPDFTIRHPSTGQIYYWEHFGLMDDPKYAQNACSKLQLYNSHGIIPSIHLITTFETADHPLTSDKIEKIIQEYFLS